MKKKKNISLVLGSGGARGYAHIGVIEELLKREYEIVSISGSSMGALIGGLYACGKLEEYKEWVLNLEWYDVAALLDFTFEGGLISGEKVFAKISEMVGDVRIEDLPVAYTAVATNLEKEKEVWLRKGRLIDVIRASIAIPTIFTPKEIDGELYIDGGVLDPLPIAPAMADGSDMIVAVSLNGKSDLKHKIKIPKEEREKETFFEEMFLKLKEKLNKPYGNNSIFTILSKTIETMQNNIIQHNIAIYPPDILIETPRKACYFYDFHKAYELIEIGRYAAREKLESLGG